MSKAEQSIKIVLRGLDAEQALRELLSNAQYDKLDVKVTITRRTKTEGNDGY